MPLFLFSLKIATLITAGMAALLALAATPRLWMAWRRVRLVTLSLPCYDPSQLHAKLGAALRMLGKPTPLQADGSFTIEPANWRKKFGLKPITVSFPQPQMALITGPSQVVKGFARSEKLPVTPVPGCSFKAFLKPWQKFYGGFLAFAFTACFLAIFIGDPDHIATRQSNAPAHNPSLTQIK